MAEVTDVDAEKRQVVLDRGDRLDYDSLIVACGGETSYFGHDEWQHVSCGLKTLADAVDLRKRFYGAFEEAERTDDPEARAEWLTFVVIGGGPTGVEVAGELALTADSDEAHVPARRPKRRPSDPARCGRSSCGRVQREALGKGERRARPARGNRPRGRTCHGDRRSGSDLRGQRRRRADQQQDGGVGRRRPTRSRSPTRWRERPAPPPTAAGVSR